METQYRYHHFKRRMMREDLSFHDGPEPGQPMPDFALPTTEGGLVRKIDYLDYKPLLVVTGSVTCPMTATSSPVLKELYAEYGERIAFLTIYVREAHPGERFPQPETFEQKLANARAYRERDQIPWPVGVDSLDGALHHRLDDKPNAAFLMDPRGIVVFRSLWANDKRDLRRALGAVARQQRPAEQDAEPHMVPLLKGLGATSPVLRHAGRNARRDFKRQVPPFYALSRLAALFRPLPPLGRGIAAVATTAAGAAVIVGGVTWATRHRQKITCYRRG